MAAVIGATGAGDSDGSAIGVLVSSLPTDDACGGEGSGRRGEGGGEVIDGSFSASEVAPEAVEDFSRVEMLSSAVFVPTAAMSARSAMSIGANPDRARMRWTTSRGSCFSASCTACWYLLARLILRARRALTCPTGVASSKDLVGEGDRDTCDLGDVVGNALAAGGVDRANRACRAANPPGSRFGGDDDVFREGDGGVGEAGTIDASSGSRAKMLRAEDFCDGGTGSDFSTGAGGIIFASLRPEGDSSRACPRASSAAATSSSKS